MSLGGSCPDPHQGVAQGGGRSASLSIQHLQRVASANGWQFLNFDFFICEMRTGVGVGEAQGWEG